MFVEYNCSYKSSTDVKTGTQPLQRTYITVLHEQVQTHKIVTLKHRVNVRGMQQ